MTQSETTQSAPTLSTEVPRDDGLLLVAGKGLLSTYPLARAEILIGRAPDCDVVIAHATLSRKHALLRMGPPLSVQDLGSRNGIRVARSLLKGGEPVALSMGESFNIGDISFVVLRAPLQRSASAQGGDVSLRIADPSAENASPLVHDIAHSGVSVLILGETGVGKELLAATLHGLSGRAGALVQINCAALAPSLFESVLFGYEKGAFTGAAQARAGLLEAANRGTVFLDEVGELSAEAQAKLLRAIEAREVVRLGAVKPTKLDVRFVAATNRDLVQDVALGRFRSDLLFRLDGVTLAIPPLRERRDQIIPLALQFLRGASAQRSSLPSLAPAVLQQLAAHDWPGNVRELKAVVERAALLARGGEIAREHVAFTHLKRPEAAPLATSRTEEDSERSRIVEALEDCAGNQSRAAKLLGISRATLVNKIAMYRIPRPRK